MTSQQVQSLKLALEAGYGILQRGGPSLAAVECAIGILEEGGAFNAGRGAYRQLDGVRRMDASIMEGKGLRAGAVASVEGVVHPITAARLVMEKTDHVLLVGPSATKFARHFKLQRLPPTQARQGLSYDRLLARTSMTGERHGTVGAVALDQAGTVSAGASTGGIERMLPGRVGDTPLIGCGVYADDRAGGVSMTGVGEGIIRLAVAGIVCERLAEGKSPAAAARRILNQLVSRIQGVAGMLVVAPDGRFAIAHVTPRMAAGWWRGTGSPIVKDRWT
ncbi:Isoaspartyl peptidase [Nitrospira japonica]|uniref:Isoaspartyl peptidase n=1 Tax=Nitrospira japonica TaxID=1325564 RepID=A0A1W1I283_9BACT|nr:Isoaspartyl peptidase [Nitrospira japonica]